MTQSKSRPPTFILFGNAPNELPESYLRYLANGLRDAFGFRGVPIRITTRRTRNPFVDPR
jgi:GTP-binding protein